MFYPTLTFKCCSDLSECGHVSSVNQGEEFSHSGLCHVSDQEINIYGLFVNINI